MRISTSVLRKFENKKK